MELYVGGIGQGKLDYVRKKYSEALVYDEDSYEKLYLLDETEQVVIWNHFHKMVRAELDKGKTPEQILSEVTRVADKIAGIVIISDEIGNGIVPMEKKERIYREETGRILIEIAERAERVERIICGISQRIK